MATALRTAEPARSAGARSLAEVLSFDAMRMPTASIKFTSDYLIEALQRYRRQHRGRYFDLTIKLLALVILVPLAIWSFWHGYIAFAVFFMALGVLMFIAHHADYWLVRRSFRKSPFRDEDATLEFTEAGLHARSPKRDIKIQWSAFTKVAHFRDGFLLLQGPWHFNWIPLSSLAAPSEADELEAILRAKIHEHRMVEGGAAPNSRPLLQPRASPEAQSSDSQRTPLSGGGG